MQVLPRITATVDPTTKTMAIDINISSSPAFLPTVKRAHIRAQYTVNVNTSDPISAIGTAQPLVSGSTWFGRGQE
jgi:hypothetical protein